MFWLNVAICYVSVTNSIWKDWVYVTIVVGSTQGKSRFTVAEDELKNSTLVEGGILLSDKNSVKR